MLRKKSWVKSVGDLTTMMVQGGLGVVMEACEHQAEELRLCPGDILESWWVLRGG